MAKTRGSVEVWGAWKKSEYGEVQAFATFAEDNPNHGKYDVVPLVQLKIEARGTGSSGVLMSWMTPGQARILGRKLLREADVAEDLRNDPRWK